MKILRVIRSICPQGGGPIEGLIQSSKILLELGNEIEVLSLDNPQEEFVDLFPLQLHAIGKVSSNYGYHKGLKQWLENHHKNYDAILIHGLWQYHSLVVYQVLKNTNTPYFVFIHGMLDPWFKRTYPLKHLKKWLYWPWAEYQVLRHAKKVLFTTKQEKILARESFWLYSCNEQIISYGTAGNLGNISEQKEQFITQFPKLRNKPFLLFLSRIHPKKGIDILIQSFADQQDLLADTQLVIAGPDQVGWQAELEALAESLGVADKITWTGMLSGDVKWGAYLCADAFILPSHQENFGIVVAEALSCHVPVLISNKVNIWREIEASSAGLVADDTVEGCNSLIKQWQKMPDDKKDEFRTNARECFLKHFEINQAADSLVAALR